MFENIQNICIILLTSAGLIYIWKIFLIFILRNKYDKGIYVIIPLIDTCENTEQVVRSAAERTLLMGKSKWDRLVCVDYGSNEETKEIINRLCNEYNFIDYMNFSTFEKIFGNKTEHTA